MKQSIATASARVWNQKNLPSGVERFGERPSRFTEVLQRFPSAAVDFSRRRKRLLVSLAALGALGVIWLALKRNQE